MTGGPAPAGPGGAALVVFDGTAMVYRAYHGGARRLDARGVEVGAVDGFARKLSRWLTRAQSRHFAVVWDAPGESFRRRIDPGYKAQRKAPPEELPPQIERAGEVARALGVASVCAAGFEADDLMATLAARARAEGLGSWLVTPDKDLFQLVDDAAPPIRVFDPVTRRVVDEAAVVARFGVPAAAIADYLALAGDGSDGISGVPGVGPKAAAAVIAAFGGLDAVYARLDEVAGLEVRGARALGERLAAGRDVAYRCRALTTVSRDAPLGFDRGLSDATHWRGPAPGAEAVFARLGVTAPLTLLQTARGAA